MSKITATEKNATTKNGHYKVLQPRIHKVHATIRPTMIIIAESATNIYRYERCFIFNASEISPKIFVSFFCRRRSFYTYARPQHISSFYSAKVDAWVACPDTLE